MKSVKSMELLFMALCWCHMSMIHRTISFELRDNSKSKNDIFHLILNTNTVIVEETVHFLNWFIHDLTKSEDHQDNSIVVLETIGAKSPRANALNSNNRTFRDAFLPCYI